MSNSVSLDQAIDTALKLPPEQRQMLIDILRSRQIEMRRDEIAAAAQSSMAAYRAGSLKSQTAEQAITELRQALESDE
jgi:hypothetical protein